MAKSMRLRRSWPVQKSEEPSSLMTSMNDACWLSSSCLAVASSSLRRMSARWCAVEDVSARPL